MSCTLKAKSPVWWEAEIQIGATFKYSLTWTDDAGPINITGLTFEAVMKRDTNDETPQYDLAANGCLSITSASAGQVALIIPDTATGDFFGTYVFSIDYRMPNAEVIRVAEGIWTTRKAATS